MKIIYRISDKGEVKAKLHFVTKRGIFEHFCIRFKDYDIYVVADNVSDETYNFIQQFVVESRIHRTLLGNARSLLYSFDLAIKEFADDEKIYLAEDDYIYRSEALKIIEEGLDVADYASGYDHPDKYINRSEGGPNPFVENGGEDTRVIITRSRHWKETNSTCMTFGTTVRIIKEDRDVYECYCQGFPRSFEMFCELIQKKQRRLITCLPAVSTHGESAYLSPFVNWEEVFENSFVKGETGEKET
jgi:hypothetical protein